MVTKTPGANVHKFLVAFTTARREMLIGLLVATLHVERITDSCALVDAVQAYKVWRHLHE